MVGTAWKCFGRCVVADCYESHFSAASYSRKVIENRLKSQPPTHGTAKTSNGPNECCRILSRHAKPCPGCPASRSESPRRSGCSSFLGRGSASPLNAQAVSTVGRYIICAKMADVKTRPTERLSREQSSRRFVGAVRNPSNPGPSAARRACWLDDLAEKKEFYGYPGFEHPTTSPAHGSVAYLRLLVVGWTSLPDRGSARFADSMHDAK
jgi:hypothetical protein